MAEITVFTYNLRTDVLSDGKNAFPNRRELIKSRFPGYHPDLVGFQEVQPHMREWLIGSFPEYELCGLGREKDLQGEGTPILFRKDRFELFSQDTFWLSDTPRVPGSRFSTDQSICPRICTCVTLRHRETGRLFRHYNTHLDHEGAFAQVQGMSLILHRMAEDFALWKLPVILTGDFNVFPDSPVCRSVLNFSGCGAPLIDVTAGITYTFHNFEPEKVRQKIDYIFTNLSCDPVRSFTAEDEENGRYLSDHYPVGTYLQI